MGWDDHKGRPRRGRWRKRTKSTRQVAVSLVGVNALGGAKIENGAAPFSGPQFDNRPAHATWTFPRCGPRRERRRPVVPRSYRGAVATIALPIYGYRDRRYAPSVRPHSVHTRRRRPRGPCADRGTRARRAPVAGYGGGARPVGDPPEPESTIYVCSRLTAGPWGARRQPAPRQSRRRPVGVQPWRVDVNLPMPLF